ncbi:MAG: hypothetical protein KTR18_15010 [Acidiferrobacterales bacterium]|nr:hypothetical protein [Acidiferrobacterales bacterium]
MKRISICGSIVALVTLLYSLQVTAQTVSTQDSIQSSTFEDAGSSLSVYWIGHSLMEAKADSSLGNNSVLHLVQMFAENEGIPYSMGDHTLWGAPLSLQWDGVAKSNKRSVPDRLELRKQFESEAENYNAMVLTETVPLSNALKYDYSSYYLRKFYCALLSKNAAADVYLYESWVGLQYLPDEDTRIKTRSQWYTEMDGDRKLWNQLADDASVGKTDNPSKISKLLAFAGISDEQDCSIDKPIRIVPVGSAFTALAKILDNEDAENIFVLPNGEKLDILHLISNPYKVWPYSIEEESAAVQKLDERTLFDPDRDRDDIHASAIGIYYAALVTYSVLAGKKPGKLPTLDELGEPLSEKLRDIAWEVVINDERTGVR